MRLGTSSRITRGVVACVALGFLLVSCSDDDDPSSDTTATTKDDSSTSETSASSTSVCEAREAL
jgi:hypothetical protein